MTEQMTEDAVAGPLGSDAIEVELDKEIDPIALQVALVAELGHHVQMIIQETPDGQPNVMHISPAVDAAVAQRLLDEHVIVEPPLVSLRAKLAAGDELTLAEVSVVLAAVLGVSSR